MNFFTSPKSLETWVLSKESPEQAISQISSIIGDQDLLSIKDGVNLLFNLKKLTKKKENDTEINKDIQDASESLFNVLSRYNITKTADNKKILIREGKKMENKENKKVQKFNAAEHFGYKKANVTRPPSSPYTSRVDDNKYVDTPWRIDRDAFYDFTHRNPDMLSFDDNPNNVYSGEGIWRRYIMDKFYRDYKDENGRLVGGYINDRFQTFHDLGGNQMALADGERTRKPRRHQWSVERRLSEVRGEDTEYHDALTASDNIKFTKIASKPLNEDSDEVLEAFTDILDMSEAGFNDEQILSLVAEHYNMSLFKVAEIKKFAYSTREKFSGELYELDNNEDLKKKVVKSAGSWQDRDPAKTWKINQEVVGLSLDQQNAILPTGGFPLPEGTLVFEEGSNSKNGFVYIYDNNKGKETRFVLEPNVKIDQVAEKMESIMSDLNMLNGEDEVNVPSPNAGMSEQVENRAGLENTSDTNKDFEIKES
jgi:hypothetical protein